MVAIFASATALLTPEFVESFEPEKLASKFVKVEKEYGVKFNKTSSSFNIVGHWEAIQNAHDSLRKLMQIPNKQIFEGFNVAPIKVEMEQPECGMTAAGMVDDDTEDTYEDMDSIEAHPPMHRIKGNPKRGRYAVDSSKANMVPEPVVYFQYQDKSFLNEDGVNIDTVLDEYERSHKGKKVTKEDLKKILEKNTEQMGRPLNKTLPRGAAVPNRPVIDELSISKTELASTVSEIAHSDSIGSFTNALTNAENLTLLSNSMRSSLNNSCASLTNTLTNCDPLTSFTNSLPSSEVYTSLAKTLPSSGAIPHSQFHNTIEAAWASVNDPSLGNFQPADIARLMSLANIVSSANNMSVADNEFSETNVDRSENVVTSSNIISMTDANGDTSSNNIMSSTSSLGDPVTSTHMATAVNNMLNTVDSLMGQGQFSNLINSSATPEAKQLTDDEISFTESLLQNQEHISGTTTVNEGEPISSGQPGIVGVRPIRQEVSVFADEPIIKAMVTNEEPVFKSSGEQVPSCVSVKVNKPVQKSFVDSVSILPSEPVNTGTACIPAEPITSPATDVNGWSEGHLAVSLVVKSESQPDGESSIQPVSNFSDIADNDDAYTEIDNGHIEDFCNNKGAVVVGNPVDVTEAGRRQEATADVTRASATEPADRVVAGSGQSSEKTILDKADTITTTTIDELIKHEVKKKSRRKSKPSKYVPADKDMEDNQEVGEKIKATVKRNSKPEKVVPPLKIKKGSVGRTMKPAKKKGKSTAKLKSANTETNSGTDDVKSQEVKNQDPDTDEKRSELQKENLSELKQKSSELKQKSTELKQKSTERKLEQEMNDQKPKYVERNPKPPKEKHNSTKSTKKRNPEKQGDGKTYKCTECDYQGQRKKRLTEHMGRVHGLLTEHCRGTQEKTTFPCDECDKTFVFGKDLNRHKKIVHHGQSHFCAICQKTYKSKYVFDKHMVTHEEGYVQPMFPCQICERQFTTKFSLGSHIKSEHLGLKKTYICPTCGKSFSQIRSYRQHANVHAGIRPYVCEICQKSFTYDKSLKEHRYMHDNIRRFPCSVCGKAFRQRTCLLIHMKVHKETKDHICSSCGKGFTQKQSLLRHERIHTGDKPYTCKLCHKSFSDYAVIRKHMLMSHKKDKNDWKSDIFAEAKKTSDHYIAGGPGYVPRDTSTSIREKNFATVIPPAMPGGPTTITDHGCGDPNLLQNEASLSQDNIVSTPHTLQHTEEMYQKVMNIDNMSSVTHQSDTQAGGLSLYHHLPGPLYPNPPNLSIPLVNNQSTMPESQAVEVKSQGIDGTTHLASLPINYSLMQGIGSQSYSGSSTPDQNVMSDENMVTNFLKQQARQPVTGVEMFANQILAPMAAVSATAVDQSQRLQGQLAYTLPSAISTATTSSESALANSSTAAWGYAGYSNYYNVANFPQFQTPPQN